MKQLVMTGPKKSTLVDAQMPQITADDQVIVKLKYCGVCMSEHYAWSVAEAGSTFGHEPVGRVYAVGKGVTKVKVGDRVSGLFAGNAEYVVANEIDVFKLPDNLSDEDAALEPLACLMSAVSKAKIYMIGEKVAVVGCGYMGCGAISLLKLRGAYVVAIDIRRESLEDAKRYGADEVYTPDELPDRYYYQVGSGLTFEGEPGGFSTVMEWGETNESLDLAINMTRMCGQLCIGAYHTGGKRLVDVQQLNVKAIDCLSTHPREVDINRTACQNAINMLMDGTWKFKNVPTKVYPIAKFDQAQEELETKYGKYMKAMVDFEAPEDMEPYII
jgi:threonine dehydrogenase-like Zn-dependent dehydrogenase